MECALKLAKHFTSVALIIKWKRFVGTSGPAEKAVKAPVIHCQSRSGNVRRFGVVPFQSLQNSKSGMLANEHSIEKTPKIEIIFLIVLGGKQISPRFSIEVVRLKSWNFCSNFWSYKCKK